MEKTKVTSSFTSNFSTGQATDFATGFPMGFTNEMDFIDKTTCVPTPPISPVVSSVDEDEAMHIPVENLLELDSRLSDLVNHL